MVRFTIKRGKIAKTFVAVAPPYPKVGDSVTLNGTEWFVTKARDAGDGLLIRTPRAKVKERAQ
jgi:hypothetical protein